MENVWPSSCNGSHQYAATYVRGHRNSNHVFRKVSVYAARLLFIVTFKYHKVKWSVSCETGCCYPYIYSLWLGLVYLLNKNIEHIFLWVTEWSLSDFLRLYDWAALIMVFDNILYRFKTTCMFAFARMINWLARETLFLTFSFWCFILIPCKLWMSRTRSIGLCEQIS